MKKKIGVGVGLLVLALGVSYITLDKETRALIAVLPTNADVLSW